MHLRSLLFVALGAAVSAAALPGDGHHQEDPPSQPDTPVIFETTCAEKKFQYNGLAGYGTVPGNFQDKYGDTVSFGSSMVIEDWTTHDKGKTYKATLWALPDRGW
jgi:hypothetical protein